MSIININCVDQSLKIVNSPLITAGDENEDYVQFSFCSSWDGYAKVAIFYKNKAKLHYSIVGNDNRCTIPNSLLIDEGVLCIGVVGFKNDNGTYKTRTSEVLRYNIAEGALQGESIEDPTLAELFYKQVEKAEINSNGHLIITLRDESELDAGSVTDPAAYDKLEEEIRAEETARTTADTEIKAEVESAKTYAEEKVAELSGQVSTILTDYAKTATVTTELAKKQDKLTAGTDITISNNVISSTVDLSPYAKTEAVETELAKKQDVLTAGDNVKIESNTVSVDLSAYAKTADLGVYATQTYVQDKIQAAVYDVMEASY